MQVPNSLTVKDRVKCQYEVKHMKSNCQLTHPIWDSHRYSSFTITINLIILTSETEHMLLSWILMDELRRSHLYRDCPPANVPSPYAQDCHGTMAG